MRISIKKGAPVGETAAPPSKSYGHRMLICAALAAARPAGHETDPEASEASVRHLPAEDKEVSGTRSFSSDGGASLIRNLGGDEEVSEDILATADCIRALGMGCRISGGSALITPQESDETSRPGMKNDASVTSGQAPRISPFVQAGLPVLPCRESGSTLRFFIPIAMALAGGGVFTGSERLMQRGIEVYEELFAKGQQEGAAAHPGSVRSGNIQSGSVHSGSARPGSACPKERSVRITKEPGRIIVEGRLFPGEMSVRGDVSSQFISGLLYALPLLDKDSILHVQEPLESRQYIDITIDVMKSFGVTVQEPARGTFLVPGGQRYVPGDKAIEGDWSNAAFLYAMKFLHEGGGAGSSLEIEGLNPESLQGDKKCLKYFAMLDEAAPVEPADASAGQGRDAERPAGAACSIDISGCPDLGPVLFAYAAAGNGGRFTGVRRLRIKESDRISCMQEELAKFGIKTQSGEDELVVYSGGLKKPEQVLCGHDDHRIVMALAVLCTLTGGVIDGAQAVRKSWPAFFDVLRDIGIETGTED